MLTCSIKYAFNTWLYVFSILHETTRCTCIFSLFWMYRMKSLNVFLASMLVSVHPIQKCLNKCLCWNLHCVETHKNLRAEAGAQNLSRESVIIQTSLHLGLYKTTLNYHHLLESLCSVLSGGSSQPFSSFPSILTK